jgi:hypothetical protein
VFGYYIEITKSHLHSAPPDYQRKQTIAGGERFTTPALKEYEEKVLGADERILERELEIFETLRKTIAAEAPRVQDTARALATLDVLASLAETAAIANFTKPHVHDGDEFLATDARHPVVERFATDPFVPNDVDLNGTTRQLVILTGPNMGGKSTYLRQTALLPLLAQIGSFVPAKDAKLPIVDRIFARVGASDNIARGQSTFMVEMQETANILHAATSRSLVVLDEIGRGTSTFDGRAIRRRGRKRSSPRTITSSPTSPTPCRASSTLTSRHASGRTTLFFCGRSSLAARTGATASRSRGWPGCRPASSLARARFSAVSRATNSLAAAAQPSQGPQTIPGRHNSAFSRNLSTPTGRREMIESHDASVRSTSTRRLPWRPCR